MKSSRNHFLTIRSVSSIDMKLLICAAFCALPAMAQLPHATSGGYDLPNGWRITPVGRAVATEDMVLKLVTAPDDRVVIGSPSGYNPHGLVVGDQRPEAALRTIPL